MQLKLARKRYSDRDHSSHVTAFNAIVVRIQPRLNFQDPRNALVDQAQDTGSVRGAREAARTLTQVSPAGGLFSGLPRRGSHAEPTYRARRYKGQPREAHTVQSPPGWVSYQVSRTVEDARLAMPGIGASPAAKGRSPIPGCSHHRGSVTSPRGWERRASSSELGY